jgi:hypothetical protein
MFRDIAAAVQAEVTGHLDTFGSAGHAAGAGAGTAR